MKRAILLFLLLASLAWAQDFPVTTSGLQIGAGPVQIPRSGLPSWLNSEWTPVFNGVNQYASCPAFVGNIATDTWSISTWVKVYQGIPDGYIFNNGLGRIWLKTNNSTTLIGFFGTSQTVTLAYSLGLWQHWSFTCDNRVQKIYRDGALIASQTNAGTSSLLVNTFVFGRQYNTSPYSNVSLAEFSIWNRALSASEIKRYKDKRLKGTESGLVALYHMNDGPGVASQTLVDSVGGKNAIASNTIQWTRRNGYAAPDVRSERYCLSFDGVDDYASATYDGSLATTTFGYSVGGWLFFRPNVGKSFWGIGTSTPAFNGANVNLQTTSGGFLQIVAGGTSRYTSLSGDNAWHHVFVVASPSRVLSDHRFYVDGQLLASSTVSANTTVVPIGGVFQLGKKLDAASYGQGKIAEFSVWKKELNQSEIQSLMYTPPSRSDPNLVFYVRGNEGTGTELDDLSPTNATMTLYNSPTWVGRDIP